MPILGFLLLIQWTKVNIYLFFGLKFFIVVVQSLNCVQLFVTP